MTPPTTPVPLLDWGARPRGLQCGECGAESLCGFSNERETVFYCANCYDDGTPDGYTGPMPHPRRKPYFKATSPEPRVNRDPRSFFTLRMPPP